jgi:hypothetical protein
MFQFLFFVMVGGGGMIPCLIPGLICSSVSLPDRFCHFLVPLILVAVVSLASDLLAPLCAFALIPVFLTRFRGPRVFQ